MVHLRSQAALLQPGTHTPREPTLDIIHNRTSQVVSIQNLNSHSKLHSKDYSPVSAKTVQVAALAVQHGEM